jgi:hypothetical protein
MCDENPIWNGAKVITHGIIQTQFLKSKYLYNKEFHSFLIWQCHSVPRKKLFFFYIFCSKERKRDKSTGMREWEESWNFHEYISLVVPWAMNPWYCFVSLISKFGAKPKSRWNSHKHTWQESNTSVKWIQMSQDRNQWWALLNMAINLFAGHSGRAVWGVGLGRLVAGIVGSNPAQCMDVCPRLSMLCCPV